MHITMSYVCVPVRKGKEVKYNTIFEVLIVLFPRIHVFWNVMLCHWVSSCQCFEGMAILQNVRKNLPIDSVTTLKTRIANLKRVQEALLIL